MIDCDQAFDCMTDAARRESPELATHLETCPRCLEMAETISPALDLLSGPVPPWMQAEPVCQASAPSATATLVARRAARQLASGRPAWLRRAGSHLLVGLGGAAAALFLVALLPQPNRAGDAVPEICTWKHQEIAPRRDAQTITMSCVVCHLDRNR